MRPVETIPEIGGGGIKENNGGMNSTMALCKLVNFTMYPPK
jgi:hypothetical protein